MGLDTTHDCWRGSYSSFNRFRYSLAEQIGINLDDYSGYNENELMPLFNHSDCDGILTVEEHEKYQEAKQRVLFEGFEYDKENDGINYNGFSRFFTVEFRNGKIEDLHELITEKIKLTETAKKEIGYENT